MRPDKPEPSDAFLHITRATAMWLTVVLAIVWAATIMTSIDKWAASPSMPATHPDGAHIESAARVDLALNIFQAVVGIAVVLLLLTLLRGQSESPTTTIGGARQRAVICAGMFVAACSTAFLIQLVETGPETYDRVTELARPEDWYHLVRALIAGAVEEPFFSALPVLLLALVSQRRSVAPWMVAVAIALSATGRAAIHLYQGVPNALGAFFWGAVAVYAYYRYRSLLGLIIGHGLWNAIVFTGNADLHILQMIAIGSAIALAGGYFYLAGRPPTSRQGELSDVPPAEFATTVTAAAAPPPQSPRSEL